MMLMMMLIMGNDCLFLILILTRSIIYISKVNDIISLLITIIFIEMIISFVLNLIYMIIIVIRQILYTNRAKHLRRRQWLDMWVVVDNWRHLLFELMLLIKRELLIVTVLLLLLFFLLLTLLLLYFVQFICWYG